MTHYDPYRRKYRGQPIRTLTIDQINQIETTLQELEGEAAKWKDLARKWEITAKEEHEKVSQLEEQLLEQQEKMRRVQEQIAQEPAEMVTVSDTGTPGQETIQEEVDRFTQMDAHLAQAQAEYENARKRLEKRFAQQLDQNIMEFLRDLLPILDNLDRAIEHAPEDADSEGVRLTRQMFLSTLDKYGVKPIEALGTAFDPEFHEALGTVEDSSFVPGSVAAVEAPGFTYRDRILRPVRVLITPDE